MCIASISLRVTHSLFSIYSSAIQIFSSSLNTLEILWNFSCILDVLDHLALYEMRAVILTIYLHAKWGRWKNDPIKILLKNFKQRRSKLKKKLLPGLSETDCSVLQCRSVGYSKMKKNMPITDLTGDWIFKFKAASINVLLILIKILITRE